VGLLVVALVVHTLAIALRIYLQGRPPVTNLYSSAIFIGWACLVMALVAERLFPLGLAALCASAIGASTLIVAHNLGNDGDTMQMMQAVLDSNFWLATHVITITLGYAATFLAGFLALVYAFLGLFTQFLGRDRSQILMKMIYGIVCFALFFSFVGTVLGGIWADQSWGRFWGWDPKENGAALVVLINAIILHARWGGIIRDRGIVFLAIAGNVVTAWSWFGTNMLGIGLHSYGFMESAVFWLLAFVVSQFVVMGLTLLPQRAWRSGNVS
jgi:ABC-type transport system involved in cytochrome c biogenesis permease subunit